MPLRASGPARIPALSPSIRSCPIPTQSEDDEVRHTFPSRLQYQAVHLHTAWTLLHPASLQRFPGAGPSRRRSGSTLSEPGGGCLLVCFASTHFATSLVCCGQCPHLKYWNKSVRRQRKAHKAVTVFPHSGGVRKPAKHEIIGCSCRPAPSRTAGRCLFP